MAVEATNWEDAYWNLRKYVESLGIDTTARWPAGGRVDPPADNTVVTGWPPGLLQDDSKALSKWLASKPDAMRCVREAVTMNSTAGRLPDQEPVARVVSVVMGRGGYRAIEPLTEPPVAIGTLLYAHPYTEAELDAAAERGKALAAGLNVDSQLDPDNPLRRHSDPDRHCSPNLRRESLRVGPLHVQK